MRRHVLSALLVLALLAGCAPTGETTTPSVPPAETPDSSQSPGPSPSGPQVQVHWDALPEREKPASTAKRLSEGPLDDFTPGNYGGVIPYIGGENKVRQGEGENGEIFYETYYRYGLCTTEGTILTDPVFDSIYRLSFYDQEQDETAMLPVWAVTRAWKDKEGEYYTAAGLLSADGAWYTGTRYRAGITAVLGACRSSAMMQENADNAVLISLADGSELARYSPSDFLSPSDADAAAWFFDDGLNWGMVCAGEYLCYDPARGGTAGEPVWLDGKTGQILSRSPMEIPQYEFDGRWTFHGGWYEGDESGRYFAQGGDLTLHYDDGREEVISLTGELGQLTSVSADNLVFSCHDEENGRYYNVLTDHALNVLYDGRGTGGGAELYEDVITGQTLPCCNETDEADYSVRSTLLTPDGQTLAVCDSYPRLYGGFTSFADGEFYRLVDVSDGTCREVFRLPRWTALDTRADD